MSSQAERESLHNYRMEPAPGLRDGGVEIRADFVAEVDTTKSTYVQVSLILPMSQDEATKLFKDVYKLEKFHRVTIENSYQVRSFVWQQAHKEIGDLDGKRFYRSLPTKSQRSVTGGGYDIAPAPPMGGKNFEMESVSLVKVWRTRDEYLKIYRPTASARAGVLKNEKQSIGGEDWYDLIMIVGSEEKDDFVQKFNDFFIQF